LCKTEEGCEMLQKAGIFPDFLHAIKEEMPPLDRRASLIAVGHIGSSLTGFVFLEESKAISAIINLCERSPCLSLRGYVKQQKCC
jgi:rapamycin-insensitive companion of mTOR